jgi:magnesium transporter
MVTRHIRNGITWIDLEAPAREELRSVMEEFGIGARVEEEIMSPTPYPLVLTGPTYSYLILHFPTTDPRGGARSQEIDFIVGKKFLITARYEVIESIHSLHRVFEAEELLKLPAKTTNAEFLIERVLRHIYAAIRDQAEQTARAMDRIEEEIFAGKEREMVYTISLVGRVLLRFDTTLSRHAEPLKAFLEDLATPAFFGKGFAAHAAHISAEHDHTASLVRSYRAVIGELRITNESLLSATQNEIIKRLTIMSFVALPLTVVASLFGMNNEYLPFVHSPYFFYLFIAIAVLIVTGLLSYFKHRDWY